MKILEKNVVNAFGEEGRKWIRSLPDTVEKLTHHWSLSYIQPVNNMSWNYVALALQKSNRPVVLKISCDKKLILDEYKALNCFDGQGAVKVYDINHEYNALLLEQAIPGTQLKEKHILIKDTIQIYAQVINSLNNHMPINNNYIHVSEWCKVINNIHDERISKHLVDKALQLRLSLLNTVPEEHLCHGDLHLENIIQQESNWLVIDPKGIIGETAFEAAAFDLLNENEMQDDTAIVQLKISDRVNQLSGELGISAERLLSWIFLRMIISAQWFVEDKGDPGRMIKLADYVYGLLKEIRI